MKNTFLKSVTFLVAILSFLTLAAQPSEKWLRKPVPDNWEYVSEYRQILPSEDEWWRTFEDPVLDSLISFAVNGNYNLSAALARIEMAKNELDITRSAYFPSINLSAGWTKGQTSGAIAKTVTPVTRHDYFSLGASMKWEIDLFGKITQNAKAGKAAYNATRAEYDGVMVSLAASVAKAYINLRTYQNELSVAQYHLGEQKKVLAIVEARFKAGLSDMLDVSQSRTVVVSTKASIPPIKAMIETSINSLALLTAKYPGELHEWLSLPAEMPKVIYGANLGTPADLLRRRPDIIQAEYQLAQYAAEVGVAKKDFLPTLSLSGSFGSSAHDAGNLFRDNSLYWEISPTLSWTLFDGMARKYRTAETNFQLEAAVDTYNYTVMNAVIEVKNAATNYRSSIETVSLIGNVIEQSKKSLQLSVDLYKKGLSPFINVVDAQMKYLENQNSRIVAEGNALTSIINLYQALGGGWPLSTN